MLTRLWCAGKLCPHPELKRFHFTCLYCRPRRRHLGKWTRPPRWINYTNPWKVEHFAFLDKQNHPQSYVTMWHTIEIDPRGHFTMLRCAIIVALDKIMNRFRRTEKPLMEFCEFFANYPIW